MIDFASYKIDKPFIKSVNSELSYIDLIESSNNIKLPKTFSDSEFTALISENNIEFIKNTFALWQKGIIPVPINYNLKAEQIKQMLNSIKCGTALIQRNFNEAFSSVCNHKLSFDEIDKSTNQEFHQTNENAVVLFTSGSTNMPKAVLLTFHNFESHFNSVQNQFNLTENDVWIASLPFYHVGGFAIIIRAFFSKAQLVIPESLKSESIIESIHKFNPTHISLVPTQLFEIVNRKISPNNNHKFLFIGGGPSNEELIKSALELGWNIVKVYGSTETCSMISSVSIKEFPNKINSSGKAFSGNSIAILDENHKEIKKGKVGEILIRSEAISKGYLNFENKNFGNKSYLTNDFGKLDKDGFLFVEMRREDLIVTGGENVNPTEVENEIKNLFGVDNCIVVGIDDSKWGQKICALIQTNKILNVDRIKLELKDKLPSFKIPKEFLFTNILPQNDLGKINRTEIKKLFMKS